MVEIDSEDGSGGKVKLKQENFLDAETCRQDCGTLISIGLGLPVDVCIIKLFGKVRAQHS